MSHPAYNDIAEWYDNYLREHPISQETVLPQILDLVGDVKGQSVCDLACGQGWIARELARRGAVVTGIDLSDQQLVIAHRYEEQEPLGIKYVQGNVHDAPQLADSSFDGCTCVLSLTDIPDIQATFQTARRILKPDGWLVFAITHPCFDPPHAQWVTLDNRRISRAVNGYFQEGFWMSESGGIRSRIGAHHRMLSTYLNTLITARFALERVVEPEAGSGLAKRVPGRVEIPSLLLIRARAV